MSALPEKYNLVVWEGGTLRLLIDVQEVDGTPPDFTGYTAQLVMYATPESVPLYTMTTSTGGITLGGAAGTVALYISATDTLSFGEWTPEAAIYELDVINTAGNGDTIPLLWGQVQVRGIA
jgi:hypothetical protein